MRYDRFRILLVLLFLMLNGISVGAQEYPEECRIEIRTDNGDCSSETLLLYQIGVDYDPVQEKIRWLFETEDDLEVLLKEEANLPAVIRLLEKTVKKTEPYLTFSPQRDTAVELTVPAGVYLLVQSTPVNRWVQTSLISVPFMNEEGDQWLSSREVFLKTAPIPEESEKTPDTGDAAFLIETLAAMVLSLMGAVCVWRINRLRKIQM